MNELQMARQRVHAATVPSGAILSPDEWLVLNAYREVRDSGSGVLIIEMAGNACTKFECRSVADAKTLTAAMGLRRLRE